MTDLQWNYFEDFKKRFKAKIDEWSYVVENLAELQKEAAQKYNTPDYPIETPVVYNRDLDKVKKEDNIKLIVIGDNPGKDEQLLVNNRYLVGQAGKIAEGYFKRNPELNIDFRKDVIILNKTPVHSAKTNQLKRIIKNGGEKTAFLIEETQKWMAEETARLHINLSSVEKKGCAFPQLWLVGYSELKEKGIFEIYRNELKKTYLNENKEIWKDRVFVFQHFSMNRFPIDLRDYISANKLENKSLEENIYALGNIHKTEIFG